MSAGPDDRQEDPRDPDDAAWARAGVPHDEVHEWKRWRIDPAEARAWRAAGIADALTAAQWEAAGVASGTVGPWLAEGIGASEAVRWHEFGFDLEGAKAERAKGRSPDQALSARQSAQPPVTMHRGARRIGFGGTAANPSGSIHGFLQARIDQRLIHDYIQHQWVDDSAIAWARQGIPASEAYLWHDLGLTAAEAGRLVAAGTSVGEVVRDWWPTGIPFGELAEWIGAGLSPAEAVEQRANGVTTEQAAALRALRQGSDDEPPPRQVPADLVARMGPPGAERPGPPPADVPAARAEVERAFTTMLNTFDAGGGLALVEGGSNLGPSLAEARTRTGADGASVTTIAVTGVRFINDHQARVSYDLTVRGGFNTQIPGRVGGAVLVGGVWKATRETVTSLLALAGVECPPPPR